MEAEIIVLSHSYHNLFPIMDGIIIMANALDLPVGDTTTQITMHEENTGALS